MTGSNPLHFFAHTYVQKKETQNLQMQALRHFSLFQWPRANHA
jgi:hypothetical protein